MKPNPYESPTPGQFDANSPPPRPAWVTIGLWGLPSRGAAMGFLWFTVALAVVCGIAGFRYPLAWSGLAVILASLWYGLAIRWVDRHGEW